MNAILLSIIARFVNADTIGGVVRTVVTAVFSFLAAWFAIRIPFVAEYFSDYYAGVVATAITALIVSGWSVVAKQMTAPTNVQTDKVVAIAVDAGVLTPEKAAEVKSAVTEVGAAGG